MAIQKHPNQDERSLIEHSLNGRLSFKAIGRELNRDFTIISKEVKIHHIYKKTGSFSGPFNNCIHAFNVTSAISVKYMMLVATNTAVSADTALITVFSINHKYLQKVQELGTLSFMERNENIIIIGPPGVGKSMIATGIGINACRAGEKVLFCNAKELMDRLDKAIIDGTLVGTLKALNKIQLLIIDELSYLKMDKEKESIFFQVIRQRYEKAVQEHTETGPKVS